MEHTIPEDNSLLFQPPVTMKASKLGESKFLRNSISVYIHFPFCQRKCFFCSIKTCQRYTDEEIDEYVSALEKEIYFYCGYFKINRIDCIHFGGGTPSLLNVEQIYRILNALDKCIVDFDEVEIVFESNPLSLTDSKIDYLSGINNISINVGVQTFNDNILSIIGRGSNYELIYNCLKKIKAKKFRSVGIDLMCNLPYSSLESTSVDIEKALSLDIEHIALYPLRIEDNSIFYNNYSKYQDGFISKDKQTHTLSIAKEHLRNKGYDHYSIYHFSKKQRESFLYSRNQIYGGEWIGLGAAAYSFYNGYVFANTDNLEEYIELCHLEKSCIRFKDKHSFIKGIIWAFIFSLRITNIREKYYMEKYDDMVYKVYISPLIAYLCDKGLIRKKEDCFQLTEAGMIDLAKIEKDIIENYEQILFQYRKTTDKKAI